MMRSKQQLESVHGVRGVAALMVFFDALRQFPAAGRVSVQQFAPFSFYLIGNPNISPVAASTGP
jgi:peptidoglycan/LPS O-acetylase OafA/YrhL